MIEERLIEMSKIADKQQEEIERLNKSLEEQRHFYLEKLQQKENIIKGLDNTIENLEEVIEQKENKEKEIRETLEEANEWVLGVGLKAILLEILDKEMINNDNVV